jgi:hypothetical protein
MSPKAAARSIVGRRGPWRHAFAFAVLGVTRHAAAQNCTDNALSTCVDTNPVWLPAGDSDFASVDSTAAQKPGGVAVALSTQYAHKPILLNAPGPDPYGTEVEAIGHVLDVTLASAMGVLPRLEVGVAVPLVLSQSGTGVSSGTSTQTDEVSSVALRDPRVSVGFDLFDAVGTDLQLSSKASYALSIPLGDETAFAGERGVVNAPQVGVVARWQRFTFGTALGLRLRAPVRLADARVGSQFTTALGLAFDALEKRRLTLALEAWAMPSLVSQRYATPGGTLVDSNQMPSEWLVSARSTLIEELTAQLGFGTAIPLSSSTRVAASGQHSEDSFAAPPTAQFRVLLAVRYLIQP